MRRRRFASSLALGAFFLVTSSSRINGDAIDRVIRDSHSPLHDRPKRLDRDAAGYLFSSRPHPEWPATPIAFATPNATKRTRKRRKAVDIDRFGLGPLHVLTMSSGPQADEAPAGSVPEPALESSSFLGAAALIPGVVEAANFDDGGEGVAYHDTTAGNFGRTYREGDVDIQERAEGGFYLGWLDAGEWLQYSVMVASSSQYSLSTRVASPSTGGTFHLEMNGTDVSGPVTIPATGDWQQWQTVTTTVSLTAGPQIARIVIDSSGPYRLVGNIASLEFRLLETARPDGAISPGTVSTVSAPRYIVFQASADHEAEVSWYVFDVFDSYQSTAPVASLLLGKPSPDANGEITVEAAGFFSDLAAGAYVGTVTAFGPMGSAPSLPVTFSR